MDKAIVYLEQRVRRFPGGPDMSDEDIKRNVTAAMVKFSRDCAEAALKAAAERIKLKGGNISTCNAILNAYPLNQIQ